MWKCHSGLHNLRKVILAENNKISFSVGRVILQTVVCSYIFASWQKWYWNLAVSVMLYSPFNCPKGNITMRSIISLRSNITRRTHSPRQLCCRRGPCGKANITVAPSLYHYKTKRARQSLAKILINSYFVSAFHKTNRKKQHLSVLFFWLYDQIWK